MSSLTEYFTPHRKKASVVSAQQAQMTDLTSTDVMTSINAGVYWNVKSVPHVLLVLHNDHATRPFNYQVWGRIGADGEPVMIGIGVVAGAGTEVETGADGWDYIDVMVESTVDGEPATGFVEIKARSMG